MSGHNKWASIKHKKSEMDIKKSKTFARIVKEIINAIKESGKEVENNSKLRKAIEYAKKANMPYDNIKRIIQKSNEITSEINLQEMIYEGYGQGGVALIIEAKTDNKNRTTYDFKRIFLSNNANIGTSGCVSWMFEKKGYIIINKFTADEESIMNLSIDNGVEDFKNSLNSDTYEIITRLENFENVKNIFKKENILIVSDKVVMVPRVYISLDEQYIKCTLKLIDELKNHSDTKNIYTNFNILKNQIYK
ncbi:MAG: YebC/PmpR family DNA-binding transcriptional regulator [Endomicrobium sp.]|nr:YebC/PmpR family DNA-binding transcriptional regulator [Endomicrobium sp.]